MGREWRTGQDDATEALQKGKPAETDRRYLKSLSHSFTLDLVLGFQHRTDAERFLREFRDRLAKFGLELHADKTRLIEFGRFAARNRKQRGEGKPETFTFLGFTHFCGQRISDKAFIVWRITAKKRMVAKLKAIKAELQRRKHHRTTAVGVWLRKVVLGYYQYHAVPGNSTQLRIFQRRVCWLAERPGPSQSARTGAVGSPLPSLRSVDSPTPHPASLSWRPLRRQHSTPAPLQTIQSDADRSALRKPSRRHARPLY